MRRRGDRALMLALFATLAAQAAVADPVAPGALNAEELVEPATPPPITVVDGLTKLGAGAMMSTTGELVVTRSRAGAFGHVELAPPRRPVVGPAMAAEAGSGEASLEIPVEYALQRNVPNPSRGRTTIGFDLPVASRVRLEVFDLQGRQVRSLADGEFPAGRYSRSWSAGGGEHDRLAPGVYFARIDARASSGAVRFIRIEKLILMN